jgi:lipoprotein-anchoring transpeptidase ErfK/SrfK
MRPSTISRVRGAIATVFLFAALAAPTAGAQPAVGEGCGPEQRSLRDRTLAFAAWAQGPVRVFTRPDGKVRHTFEKINPNGRTTVFGVLSVSRDEACLPAWYRVQLPMRPNGSTGWIRADEVKLEAVRTRLEIDLSERRLVFFRNGRLVLRTTAGTGTSGTPTPKGSYYVNQRFRVLDPSGPFGPGAIGISAFSPVLTDWVQGGPIAVHGTNDPSSVGRAASHGCIRIRNGVLRRLLPATETGSPVFIHA